MRRSLVDDKLSSLQRLHNSICKAEFQQKFCESSFSEVAELLFLCTDNGKLLQFWVSYLDLVDIISWC